MIQDTDKIALRRRVVATTPTSVAALEALGDALREEDRFTEALEAYQDALRLAGTDGFGGSTLDSKIRLTQFERDRDPAAQGQTMATRQQVCRRCGSLGMPTDTTCSVCGEPLPVDTMMDAWKRDDIRQIIIRETVQSTIIFTVILVTLSFVSWLPLDIKVTIIIASLIVLTWKGLRAIGGK